MTEGCSVTNNSNIPDWFWPKSDLGSPARIRLGRNIQGLFYSISAIILVFTPLFMLLFMLGPSAGEGLWTGVTVLLLLAVALVVIGRFARYLLANE